VQLITIMLASSNKGQKKQREKQDSMIKVHLGLLSNSR
jgi:hypothetical protein